MELKFREVGEEFFDCDRLEGLKVKKYFTIEELDDIVKECLATDNQVERHMIHTCKLAEYCTNLDIVDGDSINGNEVYNMLAKNGLVNFLEYEVQNDQVEYLIERAESSYAVGKVLTDGFMESFKKFDFNKVTTDFAELRQAMELNKK